MTRDDAIALSDFILKNPERLKTTVILLMSHDGEIAIACNGPPGLNEMVFLEKSYSNWLSDVMTGRLRDPRQPTSPTKLSAV